MFCPVKAKRQFDKPKTAKNAHNSCANLTLPRTHFRVNFSAEADVSKFTQTNFMQIVLAVHTFSRQRKLVCVTGFFLPLCAQGRDDAALSPAARGGEGAPGAGPRPRASAGHHGRRRRVQRQLRGAQRRGPRAVRRVTPGGRAVSGSAALVVKNCMQSPHVVVIVD